MDPHAYADKDNKAATKQVYEALLDVDSNLAIVPQLALAWKPLNPTTWEFELRPDVRFHDGTPFTAEDVVFSIERARAEDVRLPSLCRRHHGGRGDRRSHRPLHDRRRRIRRCG